MLGGILVLTALNLRTAVASVPPLLDEITPATSPRRPPPPACSRPLPPLWGPTFLFFSVRTPDAVAPGRLAAMAQKFGFFIAALAFLVRMLAPMLAFGCGQRARQI